MRKLLYLCIHVILYDIYFVIFVLGALTYAEIGTSIPKSGSAYYAFRDIFGDGVAFVYMFTLVFFVFPASTAIVMLTFAEYLTVIFFNDGCGTPPQNIIRATAATMTCECLM